MSLMRQLLYASALVFGLVGLLIGTAAESNLSQAATGEMVIRVEPEKREQVIEGLGFFGGARVFWEPGPYVDEKYTSAVKKLGASMARTQIYYDDEPKNDNGDPFKTDLTAFDFGPNSTNGRQFPWIRSLKESGIERLIASVWTPPVWMKEGAKDELAPFCKGQCGGHLRKEMREEFAEYLIAYSRVLKRETGVDLYAISIQNEPLFENPFEGCTYSTEHYAETLKVVRRRFQQAGLKTKFFGPEHMGSYKWNDDLGYFKALLDTSPKPLVDAYAVHGYQDGVVPDTGAAPGWRDLRKRTGAAGVPLWMTETSDPNDTNYSAAFQIVQGLHLALKEGHVSTWVYFYLTERTIQSKSGKPGPLYHLLRHYFSFLRPGDQQIASHCPGRDFGCSAFQTDEGIVVVAVNSGKVPRKVKVSPPTKGNKAASLNRVHVSRDGAFFQAKSPAAGEAIEIPASGIATWVYR